MPRRVDDGLVVARRVRRGRYEYRVRGSEAWVSRQRVKQIRWQLAGLCANCGQPQAAGRAPNCAFHADAGARYARENRRRRKA